MEIRITGSGRPEYLWSRAIVSSLLHAIICLLDEEVTSKPIIQALKNRDGFSAHQAQGGVSITLRSEPNENWFSVDIQSIDEFSPDAISNLVVGYLNATNISCDDEPPTKKYYIRISVQ